MNRQIFRQALTEVSTTRKEALGAMRQVDNRVYKYVKILNTTATVAGAAGDPVAFDSETGAEDNTVVIDLSDADNPPICAGFLCGTVTGTLATAYYGWIQTDGPLTTTTAITNGADGTPCYLTTTDKTLAKAVDTNTTLLQMCAIANDASAKKIVACCPW